MKIGVIADLHGEVATLTPVLEEMMKEAPNLIMCPGNMTDMFRIPTDFTQLDVAEMVIQKLVATHCQVLCVPGNHDPYEILGLFDEYGVNLHAITKTIQSIPFVGFGGAQTPFNTLFEPSEEEVQHAFSTLRGQVFLVHNPPKDTLLDKITSGQHVGSPAIREAILAQKPQLVITAHIHEAAGQDTLGSSVLFNPGPAAQGHYGIVTIEKGKITCTRRRVNIQKRVKKT